MSKVYILTDGGHDYSGVKEFGIPVICIDSVIKKTDIAQMYRELSVALEDFSQDDYLLLSGLTSLCAVATAIIVEKLGEIRFLVYDYDKYLPKQLYFGGVE